MSTWKERLLPGSFRGVPFSVEREATSAGRDTQVHEYPKRDQPYVEDMGRKTRTIRCEAFVVGPDCFDRRDALLKALDTPGAGELVHPWYGRMNVSPTGDCSVSHDRREGGVVRFDLVFVEEGKLEYPAARANTAQQLKSSSSSVIETATSRFSEAMETIDMVRVKANSLAAGVSAIYGVINGGLRPLTSLLTTSAALLDSIMNAPHNLSSLIFGTLFDLPREFGGFRSAQADVRSSATAIPALAAASRPTGSDAAALHAATVGLLQDAAIVNAMLDAAEIPINPRPRGPVDAPSVDVQVADPVQSIDVPVADDVIAVRDELTKGIWEVSLDASPTHYEVLTDARQLVHGHLSQVARAGERLVTVTPLATTPALLLAYQRYADASRALEISARNRIRHPGFVPALPLQLARK